MEEAAIGTERDLVGEIGLWQVFSSTMRAFWISVNEVTRLAAYYVVSCRDGSAAPQRV